MVKNILVVIPSYNEKEYIGKLIKKILSISENSQIIIVDDNSPDKTANALEKEFSTNKRIKIIRRLKKGGRGSAVIKGFQEGLKDKNIDFFIEMDADFSHNPADIQRLIKVCETKDVAIASKYLQDSKIVGLSFKRTLFSKIANLFIRFMLQVPISDYTNGFRCYKRKVIKSISLSTVSSHGFIVLSELAYRAHQKGFHFGEIPITCQIFKQRKSNFNLYEVWHALSTILRLKFTN